MRSARACENEEEVRGGQGGRGGLVTCWLARAVSAVNAPDNEPIAPAASAWREACRSCESQNESGDVTVKNTD
jgi:hypothetical protein